MRGVSKSSAVLGGKGVVTPHARLLWRKAKPTPTPEHAKPFCQAVSPG